MIDLSIYHCDICKNKHKELYKGWDIACKAYPEGIPNDYYFQRIDVTKLKECNNGYGYERKESK